MLGLTEKNISFDKNDSKSLLSSNSYIQTHKGYKKLRHFDNYKDIYLDKENQLNLSNKKNKNNSISSSLKSFNEISIENYSPSNIKKIKTEELENHRKRYITFSNDVNFNYNRENDNYNNINSPLSKKQNNYINESVKQQIIQKSLKKTENKKINNNNNSNKKEKMKENSKDKTKKFIKNNKKKESPKNIKVIYSNNIENKNNKSNFKSQNDDNKKSFS